MKKRFSKQLIFLSGCLLVMVVLEGSRSTYFKLIVGTANREVANREIVIRQLNNTVIIEGLVEDSNERARVERITEASINLSKILNWYYSPQILNLSMEKARLFNEFEVDAIRRCLPKSFQKPEKVSALDLEILYVSKLAKRAKPFYPPENFEELIESPADVNF